MKNTDIPRSSRGLVFIISSVFHLFFRNVAMVTVSLFILLKLLEHRAVCLQDLLELTNNFDVPIH
jgi:hypothetical protein